MGIFNIFKNREPNGEFEKHQQMIAELRASIRSTLIQMQFNGFEQFAVLNIIDEAEKKLRDISKNLVGSNIGNDPKKVTEKAMHEADKIIAQVPKDLKKKIMDIVAEKRKQGGF